MTTTIMLPMDPDKGLHGSKLSPYASPFHPMNEPAHLCIFNDGIPSLMMPAHDAAQGISDEALDEAFPPDAQEAAELEAVQQFVEMLATLSLLEEREEAARLNFTGVKKRWESRRAEGLVGRPHSATHLVEPKAHVPHTLPAVTKSINSCTAIMTHGQAHKMHMKETKMMQVKEVSRRAEPRPSKMNTAGNQRLPIQQPRKQN
jgi:hypothetical protein